MVPVSRVVASSAHNSTRGNDHAPSVDVNDDDANDADDAKDIDKDVALA